MSERLGFGVSGCGIISATHAAAIAANPEDAALVACYDPLPERARAFAEKWPGVTPYDRMDAFLEHAGLDVVCVCGPSGTHAGNVVDLTRAGKHALCEKPLDITRESLDRIEQAVADSGVTVGCVFQRRTWDSTKLARQAIASGALGTLVLGDTDLKCYRSQAYYDSGEWRGTWELDGGGALMNQGIHMLDLLVHLMGEVESVKASTATRTHVIDVEDTLMAILRFKDGSLGRVTASTSMMPEFPPQAAVHGEKGCIVLQDSGIIQWEVEGTPAPENRSIGPEGSAAFHFGHIRLVKDLCDAIREKRAPFIPVAEARRSVDVILAIYESARTGREVPVR